jgi:Flp pilus assembly protein TadD
MSTVPVPVKITAGRSQKAAAQALQPAASHGVPRRISACLKTIARMRRVRRTHMAGWVFTFMLAACVGWCCLWRGAAAQTPDVAALQHYQSASRLYLAGQFGRAIDELKLSLRLEPNQPRAAKLLGISYQLTEHLPEADEALVLATRLAPSDAEAWFFLGRVCYLENFFERARNALGKALHLDPGHIRAHEYLALTLEADGDPDRALEEYREALQQAGSKKAPSWSIHVEYGTLLHKLNQLEESEKQLLAARDLNPTHWRAHFELGKLYFEAGKHDRAAVELTAALAAGEAAEEDQVRICRVLARVYYAMGRDQDALKALARAEKSK